jgi:hypothetical protein
MLLQRGFFPFPGFVIFVVPSLSWQIVASLLHARIKTIIINNAGVFCSFPQVAELYRRAALKQWKETLAWRRKLR